MSSVNVDFISPKNGTTVKISGLQMNSIYPSNPFSCELDYNSGTVTGVVSCFDGIISIHIDSLAVSPNTHEAIASITTLTPITTNAALLPTKQKWGVVPLLPYRVPDVILHGRHLV